MIEDNQGQDYSEKINYLKKLKQSESSFIKWNHHTSKWESVQLIKYTKPFQERQLKTLSLNVLFDKLNQLNKKGCMEHVLNSKDRFAFTLGQIGKMDPDIVGLQEVTHCFFDMLLECQWAKSKYWISNFRQHKQGFGNILLTKIQPICLQSIKVKRLPRVVQTGFFAIQSGQNSKVNIVSFSSVHLIAYDTKSDIRIQQMKSLVSELKKYDKIVDDYVIQGDMNFHAEWETQTATKYNFKDAWLEKYENNLKEHPGFTFDSSQNSLINEIYWGFQRRKMRLDRIFYLGNIFKVHEISVTMNKPVYKEKKDVLNHIFLKGGFLYVADYFGWRVRQDKQQFLYPSDHFGLIATLKINPQVSHKNELKF